MTTSALLLRGSRILDRAVAALALAFAWVALPLLILFPVFSVAGRQFRFGSESLYELGGNLFFVLVMLSFGYAYLRDGHVRVDVFRSRLTLQRIAWIELLGCLVIVIPLSWFLVDFGAEAAWRAFAHGERASGLADLPLQWLIRASVPLGFLGLLLAAVSVALRNLLFLLGTHGAPAPEGDDATSPSPSVVDDRAGADVP